MSVLQCFEYMYYTCIILKREFHPNTSYTFYGINDDTLKNWSE